MHDVPYDVNLKKTITTYLKKILVYIFSVINAQRWELANPG
jgi:hypothetical protein